MIVPSVRAELARSMERSIAQQREALGDPTYEAGRLIGSPVRQNAGIHSGLARPWFIYELRDEDMQWILDYYSKPLLVMDIPEGTWRQSFEEVRPSLQAQLEVWGIESTIEELSLHRLNTWDKRIIHRTMADNQLHVLHASPVYQPGPGPIPGAHVRAIWNGVVR